jgi:hypothetical protein
LRQRRTRIICATGTYVYGMAALPFMVALPINGNSSGIGRESEKDTLQSIPTVGSGRFGFL